MARKKQNPLPKNDFAAEDDLDVCSFTSEQIVTGECISSFSFDDDSINQNKLDVIATNQNTKNIDTSPKVVNNTIKFDISSTNNENIPTVLTNTKSDTLADNRKLL